MIDVESTDINVETKKLSTINFVISATVRLKTARRIKPGMMNKEGKTSMALNSGGVFIEHKVK